MLRGPLLVLVGCAGVAALRATEKVALDSLPERVRVALQKQFANAVPISAERGDERNDYVYYTIVLQDGKSQRSVTFTDTGELIPAPPATPRL
jgi:hypothetical protein